MYDAADLWLFLPLGYFLTICLEIPVLFVGLSTQHSWRRKLLAGFWLTACTYPIVILVLPLLLEERFGRIVFLTVAESFAPLAECLLFWLAFYQGGNGEDGTAEKRGVFLRDMTAIVAANLASFLIGGAMLWLFWSPGD